MGSSTGIYEDYQENCSFCGNKIPPKKRQFQPRKYCSRECWLKACDAKKAASAEEKARRKEIRKTQSKSGEREYDARCMKCRWCLFRGEYTMCVYFDHHDHTRSFLHPEGLPEVCQEFEPRKRGQSKRTPGYQE